MNQKFPALISMIALTMILGGCQKKQAEPSQVTTSTSVPSVGAPMPASKPLYTPIPGSGMPSIAGLVAKHIDGVTYFLLQEGEGEPGKTGQSVTTHYTGWFENGKVFDSSRTRGTPFSFDVGGRVIKGWNLLATVLRPGDKALAIIPPHLAYGPADYGPIPGNSTLIFEMEVLTVK